MSCSPAGRPIDNSANASARRGHVRPWSSAKTDGRSAETAHAAETSHRRRRLRYADTARGQKQATEHHAKDRPRHRRVGSHGELSGLITL
jgi:hypothetical protein